MKTIGHKQLLWIEEGYRLFSSNGVHGLNIESISKRLNKNKSSFYHYFGDLENFQTELLRYHLLRADEMAELAQRCKKMKPDILNLLAGRKIDLFFHRQLRLHRANPEFKRCYEKAFQKAEEALMDKWAETLGLEEKVLFAGTFLHLIIENFMLRITEESFTYEWLEEYLAEVKSIIRQMNLASQD